MQAKAKPQFSKRIPCVGVKKLAKLHRDAVNIRYYFGSYGPDWYQELSDRQMTAADALSISLAEDSEQGTVYRTQQCLRGIGIYPLPTAAQIREAMSVSRRNDIAFLWFLMEMNYVMPQTNKNKKEYSLNERHVLSTICHLDMVTTLRGLDDILSVPVKPKATSISKSIKKKRKTPIVYESPYLEPQLLPLVAKSKLILEIPLVAPCFAPYDKYRDQSYTVENKETRFYGSNKEQTACGCSTVNKDMILQQYCPTNHTEDEHEEYAERLFDDFVRATYCYCAGDHQIGNATTNSEIVHYVQLEQAKSNNEFIAILKAFIGQVVVGQIMKLLLFGDTSEITNLFACINCPKCEGDYDRLKRLVKQHSKSQRSIQPYEAQILFSIFGHDGPGGLLKLFNAFAKDRQQMVHACVKDVWKTELCLWSDTQQSPAGQKGAQNCDVSANCVDPRDSKLMDCMLTKALAILQDDPKYVIPHLPAAHKLPLLNEWIRVRYGIKYSRGERTDSLRVSLRQWRYLDRKARQNIPVPMPDDVCNLVGQLNYGHLNNVDKCIKTLKDAYNYRVGMALINDARRFWPTMKPYMCSQGPPRSLFYAYMPSCIYDLTLVRPWAVNEYKEMAKYMEQNAAAACDN